MVNRQQLEGTWNEVKSKLREKWGIAEDELTRSEGNVEQLVRLVQAKTGQAREVVEKFIDEVVQGAGTTYGRIAGTARDVASSVREYAGDAGQAIQHGYEQATQGVSAGYQSADRAVRAGYQNAEQTVRHNPLPSVLVSFGVGLLSGVLVGVLLKNR